LTKLISILAFLALAIVACGGAGGEVAATVDGTDITVGEVEANINSQEGTISKDQFAQFLSVEIQWAILSRAIDERFDLEFGDDEIRAEADAIYELFKTGEQTREEFLDEREITEEFLNTIAVQRLYDRAIREQFTAEVADLSAEEIEAAIEEASTELFEVCVSHILVASEEEAQEVLTRLEAGEEFADVAGEVSSDTGSAQQGGVLPCGAPAGFVAPFAEATLAAPIGEVYPEVVETQFGYHVILVTERTDPTDEEIGDVLTSQWLLDEIREADVIVEERFGIWQTEPQPMVVAPSE
jgi:parvulin-like peptidyl-prolyl isomerase